MIFVVSSLSDVPGPHLGFRLEDKLEHTVAYAILGFLLSVAFYHQERFPQCRRRFFLLTILVGIAYGISDEFHQYFVPGRFTELGDVIADSLGVIIGAAIFRMRLQRSGAILHGQESDLAEPPGSP